MTGSRELATVTFASLAVAALAVLVCLGTQADAAQCGSGPGGFEAWKQEFAEEARAKGIGASTVAALMQANYASGDDRRRSRPAKFWPVARSVSRQARRLDHCRARTFAEAIPGGAVRIDPATLRRPAGTADRDLGHGDRFRQPARQSEHAVVDRHARLRLPPAGILHRAALRDAAPDRSRRAFACAPAARCTARSARPSSCPRTSWPTAPAISMSPANALSSTANFLKAHGWRAGAGYQPGEPNFAAIEAWNAASVYQRAIALMGRQIDGGE